MIVTGKQQLHLMDLDLYRSLCIDPTERRFIVAKPSVHYKVALCPSP